MNEVISTTSLSLPIYANRKTMLEMCFHVGINMAVKRRAYEWRTFTIPEAIALDIDQANWDKQNDPDVQIRHFLTPPQVACIFRRYRCQDPWNNTVQDKTAFNCVEVLWSLCEYRKARGMLPRPRDRWAIRCSDPYGTDDSTLTVHHVPALAGITIYQMNMQHIDPKVGAFTVEDMNI